MDRDMDYDMRSRDYGDMGRRFMDRADYDMERRDERYNDMRGHDLEMRRGDGHYGKQGGGRYEPMEFMGYCSGYYSPRGQDYGRGRDYGEDYGRRDYDYRDYGD
jgi:hypothetical protein